MTHFAIPRHSGVLQELYDIHCNNIRSLHNGSVTDSEANTDLKFTLKALESQSISGETSEQMKTMLKMKRTRLRQLVVAVCIYSLLLSLCLYHVVSVYQQPHVLEQRCHYLEDISLLRHVLMNIQMELRATIINQSYHEFRLKVDRAISKLGHDFENPSFILGTLIKTRVRFVHVLSEIRLEADTWQNFPVFVPKYKLLTHFIYDNLIEVARQSHFTTDVSIKGIDKALEVLTMLQEVDIYNKLDCSIAISSNETSLRSTYNNAIMQGINTIRAHNIVLGFRGVKVITPQEWNFLFSLGQNTRIFPNKDLVDMHENSSQNLMTCKEIEFELTSIINNVMALSEGLFSSLTNRINEEHSDAIKKIVIYTMLFLSCVVLFGIVCVLHHFTVNRLLALGVVEDRLNKQLMEEQDRITVILLDVVPPEYIQLVMNGTDKVCTSVKRKIQDKNNKNSNNISLKSSFESLVKTLKKSSVQPTISTISTEDEKHTKRYDGVPINVPILKCVKPDVTFGTLDSATLFMCDFIHLNDLVAVYEPDQLINLVTCLIQILEERTKLYDVHVLCKNINMFSVISGAQSQHALRHVSEIANMALDIRASCSDLEIDALPDSKLRMRISIHVSDCMYKLSSHPEPRFHIYGELVDMTRQLQKNCTANRIHISEDVGTILRQEHQYQIERRGMMICTDGRYLSTQWLLGRRVSVCNPNHHDFRGKNSMPIQLAEKAIYIFDKEKVKYISPYWMTPSGQFNESISMSESSYSDSDGSFNDSQHE